jgi:recombination protein RecR
MDFPDPIIKAIESLSDLPGVGQRSAERLIFSLLKPSAKNLAKNISTTLSILGERITPCQQCGNWCEKKIITESEQVENFSQENFCKICQNAQRDGKIVCVVESPIDIVALERTHEFKGFYQVLHGAISPMNKVSPADLRIAETINFIAKNDIKEVIIATSGDSSGEATAIYLKHQLSKFFTGKITQLAKGIPSGGELDYLDIGTLSQALKQRRDFN